MLGAVAVALRFQRARAHPAAAELLLRRQWGMSEWVYARARLSALSGNTNCECGAHTIVMCQAPRLSSLFWPQGARFMLGLALWRVEEANVRSLHGANNVCCMLLRNERRRPMMVEGRWCVRVSWQSGN
jgi:hypothetical protein